MLEIPERLAAIYPTSTDVGGARIGPPGFGKVLVANGGSGRIIADVTSRFHVDEQHDAA